MLAPIVLFVYNRPWHTLQTLNALKANDLSEQSVLYIYCDGAKENADEKMMARIAEVRQLVRREKWCKEVHVIERAVNWGLADSIVEGVTKIVAEYGKVIVLEDDIVTARGFLKYMNDALDFYENVPSVLHVSAYMFPIEADLPETFFYNTASCWGWGTWQRAWQHFSTDAKSLHRAIEQKGSMYDFDLQSKADFSRQLKDNINGRIKTWAVKWYATIYLKNGLSLHPHQSLTQNIGNDQSGEHSDEDDFYHIENLAQHIAIQPIELKESKVVKEAMRNYYNRMAKARHPFYRIKKRITDLFS